MRFFLAAAFGASLSTGAAQAAILDLEYRFEAELIDYFFLDYGGPGSYEGPPIGTVSQEEFAYTVDTEQFYNDIGAIEFDRDTGAGLFVIDYTAETIDYYEFDVDGTGSAGASTHYPSGNEDQRYYGVRAWSVEITPVPLPASLPLVGIGMAGIAFAARRRKRAG